MVLAFLGLVHFFHSAALVLFYSHSMLLSLLFLHFLMICPLRIVFVVKSLSVFIIYGL